MNIFIMSSLGGYTNNYLKHSISLSIIDCNINKIITDRKSRTDSMAKKHSINHSTVTKDMSLSI